MPLGAAQTQHDPRAQLGRLFLFCRAEKPTEFAERRSRRILACVGSRVDVGAGVALHDVGVMPNQRAGSKGASLVCGGFLNNDIRVTSTCVPWTFTCFSEIQRKCCATYSKYTEVY